MLPKTMKAAVVHAFGQPLRLEEVPMPRPGFGQILMKVVNSGVCHTDLHAADGDWPVKPTLQSLEAIIDGFQRLKNGQVQGRAVLQFS